MICAVCLRTGRPLVEPPLHWAEPQKVLDDTRPAGAAITVANGHALCLQHFQRLADWQNEVHGTPSLRRLIEIMYAPQPDPTQPKLP